MDDHAAFRGRIRLLLDGQPDMEVVCEAERGEEAVEQAVRFQPDLVLIDVSMPGMSGIEATRQIKTGSPGVLVIALTMYDDQEFRLALLRAGASGYVLKSAEPEELLGAIRAIRGGHLSRDDAR